MDIEVRLFAGFRDGRFKKQTMDLPEGTSIRDLLARLRIPAEKVSLPLVNGEYSKLDRTFVPNDIVSLFPAVGGG